MLDVRALSKTFRVDRGRRTDSDPRQRAGLFHALRPVSFASPRGSIVGVLGPNGAGKTTLLRLLSTALRPSSGTALLDGVDLVADPRGARRRMGFLSGSTGVYGRLTAREMVAYFGRLHRVPEAVLAKRIDHLFELLRLGDGVDRRCDTLSTGMKQKVSIARTLVHDPDVLVLDEPTTGLDILSARTIVELIARYREQGKTVLLATHHMHEVEELCDRLLVLEGGELCFEGTVGELRAHTGHPRLDRALLAVLDGEEAGRAA
jgi:sodium transport system ATP-binding protein